MAQIRVARERSDQQVEQAKEDLKAEARTAGQALASNTQQLADQIAAAVLRRAV